MKSNLLTILRHLLCLATLQLSSPANANSEHSLWRSLLLANQPETMPSQSFQKFYVTESPLDPVEEMNALLNGQIGELVCRFPARMLYLERVGLLDQSLNFESCVKLQEFMQVMASDSLELVLAGPSVASPMSYFGHLFLKFNKEDNVYFSRTLAFLAPIESDESMLSITAAGAFSSIRGQYQVMPYHQIISQYIEEDQRPIETYELAVRSENKRLLLYHIFELAAVDRPYNFFWANCATRIQQLLAIAFPEKLGKPVTGLISPQKVIQSVKVQNLVINAKKHQALSESLFDAYHALSDSDRKALKDLMGANDKARWVARNGDNVLPLTQAIYQRQFKALGKPPTDYSELMRLPAKPLDTNRELPVSGQRPRMLSVGWREYPSSRGTLQFRPGLFDRSRASLDLANESEFRYLDTTLSFSDDNARLEQMDLVALSSIKKRSAIGRPLSWSFSTGWSREFAVDRIDYQLKSGIGMAWGGKQTQVALIPTVNFFAGEGIFPSMTVNTSVGLGKFRLTGEIRHFGGSSLDKPRNYRRLDLSYDLSSAWSIRTGFDQVTEGADLALRHHF